MKLAILQSNYIPWRGYFDIINDADLFLFYDDVQYTKHDWRNRNKIYSQGKIKWITLPCGYDIKRKIDEVKFVSGIDWQKNHFDILYTAYKNAPYFKKFLPFLEDVYLEKQWEYLYELNRYTTKKIATEYLGIQTEFSDTSKFISHGTKNERLLKYIVDTGADEYISGISAKDYINEDYFADKGVKIIWKEYLDYPKYEQMYSPFVSEVSILDLLFNMGENAPNYIWGYRN